MGDSETEYDLDTLTSMLDSDDETTQKIEKKEISSNGNDIPSLENEELEMDDDLNALADLMGDDDDDMHSSMVEADKTSNTEEAEKSANLSAADLGLELSDEEVKPQRRVACHPLGQLLQIQSLQQKMLPLKEMM